MSNLPLVQRKALQLLQNPRVLILDLETTGLEEDAKIVDITLLRNNYQVAYSSLINPLIPIPERCSLVHNIWDEDVEFSPTLEEISPLLLRMMRGCTLVIYNKGFDWPLIDRLVVGLKPKEVVCAMELYSEFLETDRWKKLPNLSGMKNHASLVDCINTLKLLEIISGTHKQQLSLDF